jgi:hypothetical protein
VIVSRPLRMGAAYRNRTDDLFITRSFSELPLPADMQVTFCSADPSVPVNDRLDGAVLARIWHG